MKKTIYKELIAIFVGVLFFSNIITAHFVTQGFEYNTISDMKSHMISSVEEAKKFYIEYNMSVRDLNYLFNDKAIPIRFSKSIEGYDLTEVEQTQIKTGNCILLESKGKSNGLPVAITMVEGIYIVSDIGGHSIFSSIRDVITLNSNITIIFGSIIFLIVGKMAIKPIRRLMNATQKLQGGILQLN